MVSKNGFFRCLMLACVPVLISACAPGAYVVKEPVPSGLKYESANVNENTRISLVDNGPKTGRIFSSGILPATLKIGDAPIDPPVFLAKYLQEELKSRGIPAEVVQNGTSQPIVLLKSFRIVNHRVSGFSPFVTFTYLSVDLQTASGTKRVAAYVKRGKVPVWSFDEVIDPIFNQPLSLAVKELASKIARELYGYRAGDATVAELKTRLDTRTPNSFLDVYALGFTNNPKAIETVAGLVGDKDEYVRLAAISSLGNLRALDKFSELKKLYLARESMWQDRAMALKSIGDLGTPESDAFLDEEMKRWQNEGATKEATWTKEVIMLYRP